jgi:hypothetical protein
MTAVSDNIAPEITRAEGRRLLNKAARRWLGMSAAEFLKAWDRGKFADREDLAVEQVAMLIPFVR